MKNTPFRLPGISALALVPSIIYLVTGVRNVLHEHDAQAGIVLVFIFVQSLVLFVICWCFLWAFMEFVFIARHRCRLSECKSRLVLALVALVMSTTFGTMGVTAHFHHQQLVDQLSSFSEETLRSVYKRGLLMPSHETDRPWIMMRLADNPNCPPDILEKLASDTDSSVRYRVAAHQNTPTELLRRLADDPDSIVRLYLAENPAIPADIMSKLRQDKNGQVREKAIYFSKKRGLDLIKK